MKRSTTEEAKICFVINLWKPISPLDLITTHDMLFEYYSFGGKFLTFRALFAKSSYSIKKRFVSRLLGYTFGAKQFFEVSNELILSEMFQSWSKFASYPSFLLAFFMFFTSSFLCYFRMARLAIRMFYVV